MAFDRSVIPHPTGTPPVVAAIAALVLSVVFVRARGEPARSASRPEPEPWAAVRAAAADAAHAVDHVRALVLRESARAEPDLRVQSELWERAGGGLRRDRRAGRHRRQS